MGRPGTIQCRKPKLRDKGAVSNYLLLPRYRLKMCSDERRVDRWYMVHVDFPLSPNYEVDGRNAVLSCRVFAG